MLFDIYAGKRVLVVGHTGFKGSWLTLWLSKLGAKVAGYANGIPSTPSMFEILNLGEKITDYRGDIKDFSRLSEVLAEFSPEIVFHLAAKAIVRECLEDPVDAFHTNVLGTIHVLEALRRCESVKSAVIITSDKCYENVEWEYGYREGDRLGGKDPYSASKAAAEIAFSSYFRSYFQNQNSRIQIYTTRAGNVIGGGDWARDRIVPDCMRSWYKQSPVEIRNPYSTRPWQHVLEPLSGYLTLGGWRYIEGARELTGHSFNFGPPAEVNKSVLELLEEMKKIWTQGTYASSKDRTAYTASTEATLLKLCCDKALHQLNWTPTLKFDETSSYTATWYKEFQGNPSAILDFTYSQIANYEDLAKKRGVSWAQG